MVKGAIYLIASYDFACEQKQTIVLRNTPKTIAKSSYHIAQVVSARLKSMLNKTATVASDRPQVRT